jgi:cyclophilin family peptidyl-prolyl cis-trans isomerase
MPVRLQYTVKFEVALTPERRDSFLVTVREAKSPIAARRFKELVNSNFFTGSPFYRVMPGFLVQFGLSGNVTLQREWDRKVLQEERAIEHKDWNMRGTIAFATSGAGGGTQGRSTQLFINYDDNHQLDNAGVVPFGRIVRGMHVVDAIYSGYRDRPQAADIRQQGDAYLRRSTLRSRHLPWAPQPPPPLGAAAATSPGQRRGAAPAPPHGAPGGSGGPGPAPTLAAPAPLGERPRHWATGHTGHTASGARVSRLQSRRLHRTAFERAGNGSSRASRACMARCR